MVRHVGIANIFVLFSKLAENKNSMTPMIYDQTVLSLKNWIDNHEMREMFLTNFRNLFQNNSHIPLGGLVEPLLFHYEQKQVLLQPFDFEFIEFLA